jgi:REP element-mobilizing transposase RayT
VILSPAGRVVAEEWWRTPDIRREVVLDEWIVMPDHMHAIVIIRDVDAASTGIPYRRRGDRPVAPTVGDRSVGDMPAGDRPGGAMPVGDLPVAPTVDEATVDDAAVDDVPVGDAAVGDVPVGDVAVGNLAVGGVPAGDLPVAPTGGDPTSDRAAGGGSWRPAGPASASIGALVAGFKAASAARINAMRGTVGRPVWQRNYYERVIRSERELDRIRVYIAANPARWAEGRGAPGQTGSG